MSRVGKKPILIPQEVTFDIQGSKVTVAGPKGSLFIQLRPEIKVEKVDNQLLVEVQKESLLSSSLHGLSRTLVANMVTGVTQGFEKKLEMHGVGYRAAMEGDKLKITVGFSHPVIITPKPGIQFSVGEGNIIKVEGIDKQLVGQVAAEIRQIKKPEPYKGKGIRYFKEFVRRKAGKVAKAEGTAG